MIALLMFLLGSYVGVAAFAVYAETVADDEPLWPAVGRTLAWPWAVLMEYRAYRAYRNHPTGDA